MTIKGLTPELIDGLATRAADVAATDGGVVVRVEMGITADGSERVFALVGTQQAGLEQEYRITSPAPNDATSWARAMYDEWTTEVRIGLDWLVLEAADEDVDYDGLSDEALAAAYRSADARGDEDALVYVENVIFARACVPLDATELGPTEHAHELAEAWVKAHEPAKEEK